MKRNFEVIVKDYDGHARVRPVLKFDGAGIPVYNSKGEQEFSHYQPMTLRLFALDALQGRWRGEEGLDHRESHKRMVLADKICMSPDGWVEIDSDEAAMILTALKNQGREHLVVGRMKMMLDTDPTTAPSAPTE